jgi:hypothetical protein
MHRVEPLTPQKFLSTFFIGADQCLLFFDFGNDMVLGFEGRAEFQILCQTCRGLSTKNTLTKPR